MCLKVEVNAIHSKHFEIIIEGVFFRKIHRSIFGRHPVFPAVSALSEWELIFEQIQYKKVKNYLIWRLSKQNYHSDQLRRLLRLRLVPPDLIEVVLEEFKLMLDDEVWLDRFIAKYGRKASFQSIIQKLYAKGLSQETLHLLKEKKQNLQEQAALDQLLQKYGRSKDLTDRTVRRRVIQSLTQKGFLLKDIQSSLAKLKETS